ncbi:hypothetical protein [Mucilaginibacter aquariorum]|uniref:GH26 domain-containing protein n=1 Tax=Mucilaginibacter aquariorum TaxID=2967225 RepID=A0ABT1SW39_9SPHI|nr:hypothetical protein [Mucilaginibacter aquariorum]MCQ6956316.1 hypothetical protein [Mucilaginibacter aquariorum]
MQRTVVFIALLLFASCKKSNTDTEVPKETTIARETDTEVENIANGASTALSTLPKRVAFGTEGDISQSAQFIKEADYQYQYLAGDIFSNGWTTWNSPTGEFARAFLKQTGKMGKVPVFSYYNIVPAKGRYQDPGFSNLTDPEVMNKYFADWKFLLQICKEYGKTVIIHYEPDLLGYMQMYRNDASKSVIMVSSSKNADVKTFSNDARGLSQAIVAMRNKYAPNVLLGWHASQWATGYDLIKGKADPEKLAMETAAYYKSLNARFDLIFSEFSDRDAGYDQIVSGKMNTLWSVQSNEANNYLSDFDRFQRYLKRLNLETKQKIILWQIPIGNSLTRTCNNSRGHYKDNRAEYFLQPVLNNGNSEKIAQYGQAGVIAFLFGRGASDCTSFMDARGDGITGATETADDDGGYLRKAIKAYYQNGPVILP